MMRDEAFVIHVPQKKFTAVCRGGMAASRVKKRYIFFQCSVPCVCVCSTVSQYKLSYGNEVELVAHRY